MTEFPDLLAKLHNLKFDYNEEGSMEFEPYQSFMSREDTSEWLKLWTGNKQADASSLLVFGQDGSGGYTAFWLVNQGNEILEQPIVFLGSEGEISVVSKDFNDYLWLLSQNCGPMEVVYSN
ncbi:MAG: SMI1/KNR4 family protein, partial [Bacilli bacterium]